MKSRTTIAFLGDSHFHALSRWDECLRLHHEFAADIAARGVDLVVHTGDVFEAKSTPDERLAVAAWLREVADTAPVVIVRGNHDVEGDLAIFRRLKTRHPIHVEERCGVFVAAGVAVGALAWPRKAALLASIGVPVSHDEASQRAGEAMRSVLQGIGVELEQHDGPRVLAAHAMVVGSVTSVGQPLVGHDPHEIGITDLALTGAHFIALGHIHKAQEWTYGETPIAYTGSPRRKDFGELEAKSYILAHFEGAKLVGWERVPLHATPMILLEDTWGELGPGEPCGWLGQEHEPFEAAGAEIRFRYKVASDQRLIAAQAADVVAAELRAEGAVDVKVEEVVIAKPRAPERVLPAIAKAPTLPEQLGALWEVRRPDLAPVRRERLLNRLATVGGSR